MNRRPSGSARCALLSFSRRSLGSTLTAGIRVQVVALDATLFDDFAFASAGVLQVRDAASPDATSRAAISPRVIADRLS
jgi:L-2-hydroxyglutarate oxidase LhgO